MPQKIVTKGRGPKLPQRGREAQNEEHGRQTKELVLCPSCRNIKFEKRWHASAKSAGLENFRSEKGVLKRDLCPACHMIENHLFEGEVFLLGFPERFRTELLNLVQAFGRTAIAKDPQDRVIAITQAPEGYRVTLTEDESAVKLGKKVQSAFKLVDVSISYSSEPSEVARVHARYHEPRSKNPSTRSMRNKPKKK